MKILILSLDIKKLHFFSVSDVTQRRVSCRIRTVQDLLSRVAKMRWKRSSFASQEISVKMFPIISCSKYFKVLVYPFLENFLCD